MKKTPLLFVLFLFFGLSGFAAYQAKAKTAPVAASLDLLAKRVDGYWNLLLHNHRGRAALYVTPAHRDRFLSGKTPDFRDPQLKSIELSAGRLEAAVVVIVKRVIPPMTTEMETPVVENWRFENGNWYRLFDPQFMPLPGLTRTKGLTDAQIEATRQEIRDRLHFEKTSFDFGKANKGEDVVLAVKYSLAGSDPVPVAFRSTAPGSSCPDCDRERGISILGLKDQSLVPGQNQEVSIQVPTWNYDGAVNEKFTLIAKVRKIEVPFEFSVRGNVYTPLSIIPKVLRFKEGEHDKELVMRNNSGSEIKLEKFLSEIDGFSLKPFPAVIPPGGELHLAFHASEALDGSLPNSIIRVAFTFTPVDDVSSVSYRIYLNSREEKKEEERVTPPLNEKEIQQLMQQNQIVLPKR